MSHIDDSRERVRYLKAEAVSRKPETGYGTVDIALGNYRHLAAKYALLRALVEEKRDEWLYDNQQPDLPGDEITDILNDEDLK